METGSRGIVFQHPSVIHASRPAEDGQPSGHGPRRSDTSNCEAPEIAQGHRYAPVAVAVCLFLFLLHMDAQRGTKTRQQHCRKNAPATPALGDTSLQLLTERLEPGFFSQGSHWSFVLSVIYVTASPFPLSLSPPAQ